VRDPRAHRNARGQLGDGAVRHAQHDEVGPVPGGQSRSYPFFSCARD
jgi:hypothetical protein